MKYSKIKKKIRFTLLWNIVKRVTLRYGITNHPSSNSRNNSLKHLTSSRISYYKQPKDSNIVFCIIIQFIVSTLSIEISNPWTYWSTMIWKSRSLILVDLSFSSLQHKSSKVARVHTILWRLNSWARSFHKGMMAKSVISGHWEFLIMAFCSVSCRSIMSWW